MSTIADAALQAAPASKPRGYWATVARRILRDKVSMVCALVLIAIFLSALCAPWLGLADPYQGSMIRGFATSAPSATRSEPTNSAATCWRG